VFKKSISLGILCKTQYDAYILCKGKATGICYKGAHRGRVRGLFSLLGIFNCI